MYAFLQETFRSKEGTNAQNCCAHRLPKIKCGKLVKRNLFKRGYSRERVFYTAEAWWKNRGQQRFRKGTIDCDFLVRSNLCIHKKVDGVNDCSLRSKSSIDVIKAIWMIRAVLIKEIIHHLE